MIQANCASRPSPVTHVGFLVQKIKYMTNELMGGKLLNKNRAFSGK